jgi:membrane fusion protein (multidrug efflux system)
MLRPGQYINPGDKVVTLQALDPVHVDFTLPQQQLGALAVGQRVEASVDAFGDRVYGGTINAVNPIVDPSTRNVQIEATLANPRHELLPGMFATVKIDTGAVEHWPTLPLTAITYNPYGSTVFIVLAGAAAASGAASSGPAAATASTALANSASAAPASAASAASLHVQQVFVETGPTRGDQVAVVKGVQAGQTVVTSGQIKLKNGTPVVIDNRVQPADNPNPKPQER